MFLSRHLALSKSRRDCLLPADAAVSASLSCFAAVTEHVTFFGLEELFPGTGLQEIFNSNAEFRTGIRRAMREDLFVPDDTMSDKANAAIRSLSSSLMVNWKTSPTDYAALTSLFAEYGVGKICRGSRSSNHSAGCAVRPVVDR